jgi:hypothetical protein
MKAIHDVLNGRRMTPCGPGLGLEVGDSLHFFSVHPEQDDTLAYFEDLSNKPITEASVLRAGIKSGLLDIIHTWGNYSKGELFSANRRSGRQRSWINTGCGFPSGRIMATGTISEPGTDRCAGRCHGAFIAPRRPQQSARISRRHCPADRHRYVWIKGCRRFPARSAN